MEFFCAMISPAPYGHSDDGMLVSASPLMIARMGAAPRYRGKRTVNVDGKEARDLQHLGRKDLPGVRQRSLPNA